MAWKSSETVSWLPATWLHRGDPLLGWAIDRLHAPVHGVPQINVCVINIWSINICVMKIYLAASNSCHPPPQEGPTVVTGGPVTLYDAPAPEFRGVTETTLRTAFLNAFPDAKSENGVGVTIQVFIQAEIQWFFGHKQPNSRTVGLISAWTCSGKTSDP